MRYFNTSGPNIPAEHYTLPRWDLIEKGKKMVQNSRYFTIWAPRQTGKSTYFRFLATALQKDGYKVACVNFENFRHQSQENFLISLGYSFSEQWGLSLDATSSASLFHEISTIKTDKCILIIDEVEGINAEYFGDFLHSIRNAYHSRTTIKELYVNGIITFDKDNFITFHVPLYQKCLHAAFYPDMNGEGSSIQRNMEAKTYFDGAGILNLDKVILEYKDYTRRRGFQYFREKDAAGKYISIKEAALIYSFETFINAFLGVVRGKNYLEAHAALGRTDLVINVHGHEQVVEAKIYQHVTQFGDGKVQLAYHVKRLGLPMGYYLVFADTEVMHPDVIEADEIIEGIRIKTYLVRYDVDKDFTAARKVRAAKKHD